MDSVTIQKAMQAGLAAHRAGDLGRAEGIYRQVLQVDPGHAGALHLLGLVAHQTGHGEQAVQLLQAAVRAGPGVADYWCNLGHVLEQLGRLDEAAGAYRAAVRLRPGLVAARDQLGALLLRQRPVPLEEIEEHATASLAQGEANADAHFMLGVVWAQRGVEERAMGHLERAVALRPDFALARWYRSLVLLGRGEYEEGWREYEWRLRVPEMNHGPAFPQPRWDGGEIAGKRVLVSAEQGFGDVIQFLRYVPRVAERGAKVIVGCAKELERLVRGVRGVAAVASGAMDVEAFDLQVAMLSLPRVFGTRVETIPAEVPYVAVEAALVEQWKQKAGARREGEVRVGVCLAGNRESNAKRECPAGVLAPLAKLPGVVLYNLQKAAPREGERLPMVDFTGELRDFAETAALVEQLDLVISVDTAVAHLAGALGVRTWVLLHSAADWRWGKAGEKTAWYPTMRLFRQKSAGEWGEVGAEVAGEVRKLIVSRS